ncbi:MAG: hypothetical protein V3U09_05885 [Thermoplasmata archaeon]
MNKTVRGIFVWFLIFSVFMLGGATAMSLLEDELQSSPAMIDNHTVSWNFDLTSDHIEEYMWEIAFDDFFPEDSADYIVYPKIYTKFDMEGPFSGFHEIAIWYYLNGVRISGAVWDFSGSSGWTGLDMWEPGGDYLGSFSNSTPLKSGNLFETKLVLTSIVSEPSDGKINITAGPLYLYAHRTESWITISTLSALALISGVIALPVSLAVIRLSQGSTEDHLMERDQAI